MAPVEPLVPPLKLTHLTYVLEPRSIIFGFRNTSPYDLGPGGVRCMGEFNRVMRRLSCAYLWPIPMGEDVTVSMPVLLANPCDRVDRFAYVEFTGRVTPISGWGERHWLGMRLGQES